MKIQSQPDLTCFSCHGKAIGKGETGTRDLYICQDCGRNEWFPRLDRRGSARKKATDDPYEIVACSGQIGYQ